MDRLAIGLAGASGKLGRSIMALALHDPDLRIVCGVGRSSCLGEDLGKLAGKEEIGLYLSDDCDELFEKSSLVIDVSTADNLQNLLTRACQMKKPLVVGTTGHSEGGFRLMSQASQSIPLFHSPNFSLGLTALAGAVSLLSRILGAYDVKIVETHHIHKKDRPSGTALKLSEAIGEACGKEPPIESQRTGEVIGEHTVTFSTEEEQVSVTHRALTREVFAKGALLAVKFLARQPPGLYSMPELLGNPSLCAM